MHRVMSRLPTKIPRIGTTTSGPACPTTAPAPPYIPQSSETGTQFQQPYQYNCMVPPHVLPTVNTTVGMHVSTPAVLSMGQVPLFSQSTLVTTSTTSSKTQPPTFLGSNLTTTQAATMSKGYETPNFLGFLPLQSNSPEMVVEHDSERLKCGINANSGTHTNRDISDQAKSVLESRKWESVLREEEFVAGLIASEDTLPFSVMSWNVLSQDLIEPHMHLYRHVYPEFLLWEHRRMNFVSEFKQNSKKDRPHIVCLQEVNQDHFKNFYYPLLKTYGYDGYFKKRRGDKQDGCATFYRKETFDLDVSCHLEYFIPTIGVLDRDNIGLVLVLKPKKKGMGKVCVANTHLLFNPKRGDVKLAQIQLLLATIDQVAYKTDGGYYPVILCGDFNLEPHCDIYRFLTDGSIVYNGLDYKSMAGLTEGQMDNMQSIRLGKELIPKCVQISDQCQYQEVYDERYGENQSHNTMQQGGARSRRCTYSSGELSHEFNLKSVYDYLGSSRNQVTTHHSRVACTVDYIFYSSPPDRVTQGNKGTLKLMERYTLLTDEELRSCGSLPNEHMSSDHIPLIARFTLN